MDTEEYNGWPNFFTWDIYNHLSSYPETESTARAIVASAPSGFVAANRLSVWVQESIDTWLDQGGDSIVKLLATDLLHAALRQIDWNRLVRAFQDA